MSTTFIDPILHIEVDRVDLISLKESGHVFDFNLISLFDWIIVSGYINPLTNLRFSIKSVNQLNKMLHQRKMIPFLCKSKSNYKLDTFIKDISKFNTIIKFYDDFVETERKRVKTLFEEITEDNYEEKSQKILQVNKLCMLYTGVRDGVSNKWQNGTGLIEIINNFQGMHRDVLLKLYSGNTNPI
jgi:hypothetical protein